MILEHYVATDRLELQRTRPYVQKVTDKPRGLWLSVKGADDWPSWLRSEEWGLDRWKNPSMVELTDNANILHLTSPIQLISFTKEFGADLYEGKYDDSAYYQIDWVRVSETYDGIIIAPYQWPLRLSNKVSWYYGWDVASGCIWNLDKIKRVDTADFHPDDSFAELLDWTRYNAAVKLEQAQNRADYGTDDPTGGAGRTALTLAQWRNPYFSDWRNR